MKNVATFQILLVPRYFLCHHDGIVSQVVYDVILLYWYGTHPKDMVCSILWIGHSIFFLCFKCVCLCVLGWVLYYSGWSNNKGCLLSQHAHTHSMHMEGVLKPSCSSSVSISGPWRELSGQVSPYWSHTYIHVHRNTQYTPKRNYTQTHTHL